jgi:hypothetical protein
MLLYLSSLFQFSSRAVPWRVWAGSRLAALLIGIALVWALFMLSPIKPLPETPAIQAVADVTLNLDRPRPLPVPVPAPKEAMTQALPLPTPQQPDSKVPDTSRAQQTQPKDIFPKIQDRPTPDKGSKPMASPTTPSAVSSSNNIPRVATAPSAQPASTTRPGSNSPATAQGTGSTGRLGSGTLATLRARECARLDVRDRPADCPPNEELMRMLAQERGPQYRPENADGFSRNELAWRGIPPPCLDDGANAAIKGTALCIRFGNTPSRVRTPQEICEAKGLGGCAPTPSQAAVNAALEQVRRQKAGN